MPKKELQKNRSPQQINDPDCEETGEILDELIPQQPVFPTFGAVLTPEKK